MTKWFQVKEQSAGEKRLLLTWWIYKHMGEFPVRVISFFVALVTFFVAKSLRKSSFKYFETLYNFTKNKSFYPSFINSFRQFLSYANSLVDKMVAFSGNFDEEKISFENTDIEQEILNAIKEKRGAFFITTHIGNVEMMRTFLFSKKYKGLTSINTFLQRNQCEVFSKFVNKLGSNEGVDLFAVEDINIDTSIKIKEKLEDGQLVFMAGDRISAQTIDKNYEATLLGRKILLPEGILRFALLLQCPIFFIVCGKEGDKYLIKSEKFTPTDSKKTTFQKIQKDFTEFLEKYTLMYPYQFYHFYDIFED